MLFNVATGGELYQTFSARNHQWKREGRWNICPVIDALTSKDHCKRSWAYWYVRKVKL
jgi:hypothetical protein